MTHLALHLREQASSCPDRPLFTFLDGGGRTSDSYTYQAFERRASAVASALLAGGHVAYGDRVLLVYQPGLDFAVAFYACIMLGAVPVPVPPPDAAGLSGGLERLAYVAADAGATQALTSSTYEQQFQSLVARSADAALWLRAAPLATLRWTATDRLDSHGVPVTIQHNPLLFLQYTSGSTQTPRGVMVSHENVWHNCWATLKHTPVGVSWLPHYHDMGLIGYYLFIAITGGSMIGFSGAHFLKRPLLWLETITRYGGTISSAPNFAYEYCLRDDKIPPRALEQLDLSSMCCMMNASEPVRASTYERFLQKFAPCGLSPKASVVFYGLAENTLSVTGNGRVRLTVNSALLEQSQLRIESPRTDGFNQRALVSCGQPLDDIDVRIVDANTSAALGEDSLGEVWIAGPSRTQGYWNPALASQGLFDAAIEDDETGGRYLRTGDVGFLHDGELYICGRLKDVVIIGGRNYYPSDIEAVVEAASSKVRPGCTAAFGMVREDGDEGVVVMLEATRSNDLPDLEALSGAMRRRCHLEADVIAVVPHGTIIKTSSGKISRQACRQLWQSGTAPLLGTLERRELSETDVLRDLLARLKEAADDSTLADVGIDSLTLVDLSVQLERLMSASHNRAGQPVDDAMFDLRVLQSATVGELRALLTLYSEAGEVPEGARDLYLARQADIERDQTAQMRQDAVLPDNVHPQAAAIAPGDTVLLTGATGFLGSFLMEALLRLTDYRVVAVVRGADDEHAMRRLDAALQRTGLVDDEARIRYAERVRVLNGNLEQPRLGLTATEWSGLAHSLGGIYHCGAEVDYVKPYERLRSANVGSTLELLRLAATGRPKVVHYVSTTFMFGFVARDVCRESDANAEVAGLNFGYAQSKWVAEQLVLAAADRGMTAQVYRPSLISASAQGRYAKGDLIARILTYMIAHGLSVDVKNQFSLVPADVCAHNIVSISQLADPGARTFHVTADRYSTMQHVCEEISARFGYPFDYVSLPAFIDHMNRHCTRLDPLFPLMAFFNQNYHRIDTMRDKRYDNSAYRHARQRAASAMAEPPLGQTAAQIVAFLRNEQLVPAPPARGVGVA